MVDLVVFNCYDFGEVIFFGCSIDYVSCIYFFIGDLIYLN